MKILIGLIGLVMCCKAGIAQTENYKLLSPNKNLELVCSPKKLNYTISYKGKLVLADSKLGLVREDEDFSKGLVLTKVSKPTTVSQNYTMVNAKKSSIIYKATQTTFEFKTLKGSRMNIIFNISDDGIAFRYEFPEKNKDLKRITKESTSFRFLDGTRAWMQPKADAQTGFEHTNPSYEAHYNMDIPVGTPSSSSNGWVYPALFKSGQFWMLLTEADLGRGYCGTSLAQKSVNNEYLVNFPQPAEGIPDAAILPESVLPWKTPWRIMAIGDLKTISESTLGTDLAQPAIAMDKAFIQPGKAAWSWVLEKDAATIYPVQKKYVDYAASMNWQYSLIDANWDKTIGYDSIAVLAKYAKEKHVGLLLWYNSAGNWNTVKFTPRDQLLTHQSRVQEFARLKEMGIKGVKIDFFAGDGQSMINYYRDILEDAASYQLLVNFHGATLPRGLQRTYPNLMTTEAVFGYEMISFSQDAANKAPSHAVMSAMVRNVFDPMDFTPMVLYKIPGIKRITTPAFELATSVIFLSGIQHFAETPSGMSHVPDFVKTFLMELPTNWDDTRFIDGYPGQFYIVARRSGKKWYVSGINGENKQRDLSLNLAFLANKKAKLIFSEGSAEVNLKSKEITVGSDGKLGLSLKGNDGFTLVFED
ncbi:glycoside hydrolase family 97 protein [Pedobacter sp. KBS0701]|uniref:glycoside hydrolase family 97 protein n=1 Tax=Pedobacter sp. KBS0701 TaxID=2578106 RepID=UPI00110E0A4F|nr:glycoside hydrolase family 97 protein [Pedobacter sp. KBS0701]QDW23474.1 glycoside hydrolase family 97 protein [Pedobacter sp. KBS0701]